MALRPHAGPEGADAQRWIKGLLRPSKSDQALANTAARAASWAKAGSPTARESVSRAYAAEWMEKIRGSAP
ncbi:MAG: hypothetical protein IPN17_35085 [Deltaproteobacteria bacterium]|nr:hypothetical protein [Deltaproteobacteria bacterium]